MKHSDSGECSFSSSSTLHENELKDIPLDKLSERRDMDAISIGEWCCNRPE